MHHFRRRQKLRIFIRRFLFPPFTGIQAFFVFPRPQKEDSEHFVEDPTRFARTSAYRHPVDEAACRHSLIHRTLGKKGL